jgi:hypothetical protein
MPDLAHVEPGWSGTTQLVRADQYGGQARGCSLTGPTSPYLCRQITAPGPGPGQLGVTWAATSHDVPTKAVLHLFWELPSSYGTPWHRQRQTTCHPVVIQRRGRRPYTHLDAACSARVLLHIAWAQVRVLSVDSAVISFLNAFPENASTSLPLLQRPNNQ